MTKVMCWRERCCNLVGAEYCIFNTQYSQKSTPYTWQQFALQCSRRACTEISFPPIFPLLLMTRVSQGTTSSSCQRRNERLDFALKIRKRIFLQAFSQVSCFLITMESSIRFSVRNALAPLTLISLLITEIKLCASPAIERYKLSISIYKRLSTSKPSHTAAYSVGAYTIARGQHR